MILNECNVSYYYEHYIQKGWNSNILLTIISDDLNYLTVLCGWVLRYTRLLDFHLNILVGAL